jgi:hypothetical protein
MRRAPKATVRFVLAVLILGVGVYVLRGREYNFSLWGGLAMAFVYIALGTILGYILRRRR